MVVKGHNYKRFLRYLPLFLLMSLLALFIYVEAYELFDLKIFKDYHQTIKVNIASNFYYFLALFVLIYAISTAVSFPGATVLSLLGGYFFGTFWGGGAILIGASTGAITLFLAARLAFGERLRARVAPFIKKFEKGFHDDAFYYLLMLRLVPIFPFFVVNLVPAFLNVSVKLYVLTTFFGIMPACFIYAGLGAGIENLLLIDRLDFAFFSNPQIWAPLLGLAFLALLPVLFKKRKGRKK